jgi:hypothetical protein
VARNQIEVAVPPSVVFAVLAQGQGGPSTDGTPEQASKTCPGRAAKTGSRPSRPQQRAQAADPGVHAG